ncbi:MAG TPA: rhomboid family intramembrane serine protease [Planctomycetes bacterium]|nr:rhomboid family intramembrane serine protease [Planctomycetota bacterium]
MRVLLPPITKSLLISWWVIGLLSLAAANSFSVASIALNNAIWREPSISHFLGIFIYPFLHDGFLHLFFNSIVFASLGALLESTLTRKLFIRMLVIAGILPALAWLLISLMTSEPPVYVVGGSGLVYALFGACLCLFPNLPLNLVFVEVKLFTVAVALIAYSFIATIAQLFGAQWGGSAHAIHFFGALCGWILVGGHQRFTISALPFFETMRVRKEQSSARKRQKNSQRVDDILAKVSRDGIGSLSTSERKFLEQQSRKK